MFVETLEGDLISVSKIDSVVAQHGGGGVLFSGGDALGQVGEEQFTGLKNLGRVIPAQFGFAHLCLIGGSYCEFRRNPAGDSDLKPATVPI
jgi:hypothetical protein